MRAMLWVIAATVVACAASTTGSKTAKKDSAPFAVDQPFPSEARLAELAAAPAPEGASGLGQAPANIDTWAMQGALPTEASHAPFSGDDPLQTKAAALIGKAGPGLHATDGLMCFAREYARFVAAHTAEPPADIRAFMSGRCGTGILPVRTVVHRKADNPAPKQLLQHVDAVAPGFSHAEEGSAAGLGWAKAGESWLYVLAWGRPNVTLEPVPIAVAGGGSVILRGSVNWPVEWLDATVTHGDLGYAKCVPIPGAATQNAEFALQCPVDPKDPVAFIQLSAAQRGELLGHAVLGLVVSPDGSGASAYQTPQLRFPVDAGDFRPEGYVAALNSLRGRAKLPAVRLSSEQSTVVHNLFAHLQGQQDPAVRNEIALGVMAGWQIEGTVRSGRFNVEVASRSSTLPRALAGSLASPSFRSVALDPDSDVLAIGTLVDEATGASGVLYASYDLFEPRDFGPEERAFFDALDRQRASVNLPPVVRVQGPNDTRVMREGAERIRTNASTPIDELDVLLKHFVSGTNRDFRGVVFTPMRIEGWRPVFPKELFADPHLAAAATISYFRPEGAAWGQHVVLLVYTRLDGPMR